MDRQKELAPVARVTMVTSNASDATLMGAASPGWSLHFKRLADICGAALLLAALSPLFALIAVAIRISMGKPVLFRQPRLGWREEPFVLLKFRTMREAADRLDAERLTTLGSWLRRSSLDELPQLLNVLRGEMSLVGPRPLFVRYGAFYSERERKRHEMRPGLTGWAQVHGRNLLTWDDRLGLDVWYVEHWSLLLDPYILLRTLVCVWRGEGFETVPGSRMQDLDMERGRRGWAAR